jgi:OmpA-OmpF porin, OOP family
MKIKFIYIFLTIFILLLFISSSLDLISDERPRSSNYGIFLGYNLNSHLPKFKELPDFENCCDDFKTGNGMGIYAGFIYQYPALDKLFIDLKVGISGKSGILTKNSFETISLPSGIDTLKIEHEFGANLMSGFVGLGVSYPIWDELSIFSSFDIGQFFSTEINTKEEIIEPQSHGQFISEDGEKLGRIRNKRNGKLSETSIDLSLSFGLSYRFALNRENTLFASPEIKYSYGISDLVPNVEWKISQIAFGVSVNYSPLLPYEIFKEQTKIDTIEIKKDFIESKYITLGNSEMTYDDFSSNDTNFHTKTLTRTDTLWLIGKTKPIPPKIHRKLFSSLDVQGFDSLGNKIDFNEISVKVELTREIYPLLPYIFFSENSAVIPKRYEPISDGNSFDESLLLPSPITYHRNNLNIIGTRLEENQNAKITLNGYTDPETEADRCDLAFARAQAVKVYILDNFNVGEEQIIVSEKTKNCYPKDLTRTKSPVAYQENRRVEISSDRPELLFAVTRTLLQQPSQIRPSKIEIIANANILQKNSEFSAYPRNENNAKYFPPSGWDLNAKQSGLTFIDKSGKEQNLIDEIKITRNNARQLISGQNIEINFTAFGDNDSKITKSKSIQVQKDTAEYEVEKLTLTVFRVSQATLDSRIKKEIKKFISNMDENAKTEINITGFSDDLGDARQNKALSAVRAEEVRKYIRSINRNIKFGDVIGAGSSEFPPGVESYKTPEERFISRTVEIEIRSLRSR